MNIHYHPCGIFTESRCTLENWGKNSYDHTQDKNPETTKNGVRCYNIFTGLFLCMFGFARIEWAKNGDFTILNSKSFKKWKEWKGLQNQSQSAHTAVKTKNVYTQNLKQTIVPAKQFTDQIVLTCGENFSKAFTGLLSHIPPTEIVSFEDKGSNRYILTFKRPLALWLDSRDREGKSNPVGGTIILLGHNTEQKLEISLCPETSKMKVVSGLNLWCDTSIGVRKADVIEIRPGENKRVELTAGAKLPLIGLKTQTKRYPLDRFSKVWSEATYLNQGEDYKKFHADKVAAIQATK